MLFLRLPLSSFIAELQSGELEGYPSYPLSLASTPARAGSDRCGGGGGPRRSPPAPLGRENSRLGSLPAAAREINKTLTCARRKSVGEDKSEAGPLGRLYRDREPGLSPPESPPAVAKDRAGLARSRRASSRALPPGAAGRADCRAANLRSRPHVSDMTQLPLSMYRPPLPPTPVRLSLSLPPDAS